MQSRVMMLVVETPLAHPALNLLSDLQDPARPLEIVLFRKWPRKTNQPHFPPPSRGAAGAWDKGGERASDEGGPLQQYRL